MYEVEIIAAFSAAHRLRDYNGKCEHLHGHNYRVHVSVRASQTGRCGMVIDFGDLKKASSRVLERLDHSFLNEIEPFVEIEPSAENIAAFLFSEIARELDHQAIMLYSVSVWESDTSRATFFRADESL
ncbi:MAG: 6-carboxytetrahydropterin synthase QueD [Desulfomonile sp.]|jgi:6-pyruvoyltetrahydropterin/6-carboxytetrahydropterin synthase|nr:6-carboxytetrahydropterin synthase QueD [Deltaproteobacteria bacterium]